MRKIKERGFNLINQLDASIWAIFHFIQGVTTFVNDEVYFSIFVFIFSFVAILFLANNEKHLAYVSMFVSCLFLIPCGIEFFMVYKFLDSNMLGIPISFILYFLIINRTAIKDKLK